MSARSKLWMISSLLYIAFFCWYTDFRGPLTEQEISSYESQSLAAGKDPDDIAMMANFMRKDTGRQFLMINAIDYNENPGDIEGAEAGESAEELMARYMTHMLPAMLSRGSHPVIMGEAASIAVDIVGIEGAEQWDVGAIFRYRSRRTFFDIVTNPDFRGEHHFKHAALTKTIAYPIETQLYFGDLRWMLGLLILAVTAFLDALVFPKRQS
ncbi:hypothetical protein OAD77_02130 [Porticoccaceae bacterium]|nr:hypothetical protein [Porticoccaceae bacterium]MDC0011067.1 hypothetical protein [Porticoccaceae bacterium]MDC1453210.1 hypothetical protein [Porticoccaceae bacterium]